MTKKDTICVQGSYQPNSGDPRVLPLVQSTTYYYETPEEMAHLFDHPKDGHIYSRISNPTVAEMESKITLLEGGVAAMACASGMSAITLAVLTLATKGDNFITTSQIYGGTYNLFKVTLPKMGIEVRFVDSDASEEEIEAQIDDRTKFIFGEIIANPAMTVFDFEKFSKICQKYQMVLMIDNTLATPILCTPFEYGANVIVHSTTKYMDGHAGSVGGVVVDGGNFDYDQNKRYADFYTPDDSYHGLTYVEEGGNSAFALKARMQFMRDIGANISPFNAYLTNLGMETLHLRMQRHSENAQGLAEALQKHPMVDWVSYPGLPGDANEANAKRYLSGGYSGMLTFGIKGGREKAAALIKELKIFKQVTHIADVRSCLLHPATTTHRQLSNEDLEACGIPENLIRLSVGIEALKDLTEDLIGALDKI